MRSPPLARAECGFTIGQLASSSVVGAAQPRTSCGSDTRSSPCWRAGSADNSLIASAELRDRQVHQRRSMLKGQLRDRSLPPSRQHPSFILPPVSRRLEAGGRIPCQEKGTRGLARLVLPAAGGNLRHRVQGEDPPVTEPGSSRRHSGCSGCLASDPGNLPVRSHDLRRPLEDPCHRGHSYVPTDSASLRFVSVMMSSHRGAPDSPLTPGDVESSVSYGRRPLRESLDIRALPPGRRPRPSGERQTGVTGRFPERRAEPTFLADEMSAPADFQVNDAVSE